MTEKAAIHKIIPFSFVDGPGNRTAIFVGGCNLTCAYCHNPETQKLCCSCKDCVKACKAGALTVVNEEVCWNRKLCTQCDQCISICKHNSSPKVKELTAQEVLLNIVDHKPFIRGITVSGGECCLYPGFLLELFTLTHEEGLTCLIDSNGMIDLSLYPELMEVCDGVMLDVKSWNPAVYYRMTGGDNRNVLKNLVYLDQIKKLSEVRVICLPGESDAQAVIKGIAAYLPRQSLPGLTLKLIQFRAYGVRGRLRYARQPSVCEMKVLEDLARSCGFHTIVIT